MEEVLLESNGNGGLAGGGEASEPDSGTLLLAEISALSAGEACVPGNVAAGDCQVSCVFVELTDRGVVEGQARRLAPVWKNSRRHC